MQYINTENRPQVSPEAIESSISLLIYRSGFTSDSIQTLTEKQAWSDFSDNLRRYCQSSGSEMVITVEKRQEIYRLHKIGTSHRAIAEIVKVSRAAVTRYIKNPHPVPKDSLNPVDSSQIPPGDFSKDFDVRVNRILDRLLTRYHEIADDPDTPNRDLISLGKLIQAWSSPTSKFVESERTNDLSDSELNARWEKRKLAAARLKKNLG